MGRTWLHERGVVYDLHGLIAFVWGIYYVIVGSCPAALGQKALL